MIVFVFFLGWIVGAISGFVAFMWYGLKQATKLEGKRDKLTQEVKKKAAEMESQLTSVRDRLAQASQLAQAQATLRSQAELPSKNATHSKYKNGLVTEIQALEQQKIDILKTILAEGFNPVITVIHDGNVREEVSLSDYVAAAQHQMDMVGGSEKKSEPPPTPATENSEGPKQVGKFFVYKGGKPDGTVH